MQTQTNQNQSPKSLLGICWQGLRKGLRRCGVRLEAGVLAETHPAVGLGAVARLPALPGHGRLRA
eukprot:2202918-Amphidinium_carterae.1